MAVEQKSWRGVIKVHPAAEKWPMMPEAELRALGEDIKANGLRIPVALYAEAVGNTEPMLLDGRNRLDAMELVGLETTEKDPCDRRFWKLKAFVRVRIVDHDPWDFTISANGHRRHLTAEQKRELIAELLKERPERSNRATAAIVGASDKTAAAVRTDLERRSEIPNVSTRIDTTGRTQPAKREPMQSAAPVDQVFLDIREAMRLDRQCHIGGVIPKIEAYLKEDVYAHGLPDVELFMTLRLAEQLSDQWTRFAELFGDLARAAGLTLEKRKALDKEFS